tara:strand:- start:1007 stop:1486 length:480 start_codon:yes stop_codon:yes gene_type:complete
MTGTEYTLEEISYSRKEDRRIMESVLKNWLVDPKTLNFFSPELKYPFNFKKYVNLYYSKGIKNITTIVLKHEEWIIGHVSLKVKKNRTELFHLLVDSKYRKRGLGLKLLQGIENYGIESGIQSIRANIQKKNVICNKLLKNSGYGYKDSKTSVMIKKIN